MMADTATDLRAQRAEKDPISHYVSEIESNINSLLLVLAPKHAGLRRALLAARSDIREAIGEARS
jgi:hypothetical protein